MSYTLDYSLALGASKAGLADLRAQLVDTIGASVGAAISTGFVEVGGGNYLWHYTAFPDDHRGGVRFYSNAAPGTLLTFVSINPEEAERIDAKISTRSTLTAAQVWANATRTLSSFGTLAADIWSYVTRTLTGTLGSIQLVSAVTGNSISVYRSDTWRFTLSNTALNLTSYETIALVVKRNEDQADDQSTLYLRSEANGLHRIGGQLPLSTSNGTLTIDNATQISVLVSIDETPTAAAGVYKWWLKGFDTTPGDDEGYTLATGDFRVKAHGVRAVV